MSSATILGATPLQATMSLENYIRSLLVRDIDEFCSQSYETFELHVTVQPTPGAERSYTPSGRCIGFQEYTFEQWSHPPKSMPVTLTLGQPRIHYTNDWHPVGEYLKHLKPVPPGYGLYDTSTIDTSRRLYEQQGRWWLANGKKFRLLDLPAELRDIIYGHVFGPMIKPYSKAPCRRIIPSRETSKLNLLLASKLVHQEASSVLFLFTPFFVESPRILRSLTKNSLLRSHVSQLEIAFSHEEFLALFRTYSLDDNSGEKFLDPSPSALALGRMNLDRLVLTIAAPSWTTQFGTFDGACQKAAVNWILEAAWPFLRGQPVELAGFVKRSQKMALEAKFQEIRANFLSWQKENIAAGLPKGCVADFQLEVDDDGGVLLNDEQRQAKEANEDHLVEKSLRCSCKVSCVSDTWTEDD